MPRRTCQQTASSSRGGWRPLRARRVAARLHTSSDLLRKLALRARVITRLSARRISPALQAAREEGRPEMEKAEAMLQTAEQGFKENYALLKKLSEM